ncbi:MAG TPA: tail fiber domain-containing protein [Vicinamibacteria bacterium]|nr:tail fiber domain-containing protein [Vicinamibacteria bacterium]
MKKETFQFILHLALAVGLAVLASRTAMAQDVATEDRSPGRLSWDVHVGYDRMLLVVSGPDGEVFRQEFENDPSYELTDENGMRLRDGKYNYELRALPQVDASSMKRLTALRESGDEVALHELMDQLGLTNAPTFGGAFTISDGSLLMGFGVEMTAPRSAIGAPEPKLVHTEDVSIQGSLCTGIDCANVETFSFDTIRLKENNLQIHFDDTSTSAGFPANDWRIITNDSNSGGASYFTIQDSTAGIRPFTIAAGAPANSLYVDAQGDLGIGTSTPVVKVHGRNGNTPTMRLEQDGSSGFTPQTWDVAGNEANFFVRDVTNGSRLPLIIRPNAPSSSIDIAPSGDVGFGTSSPGAPVHIRRTSGEPNIRLETTASAGVRFELVNLGGEWEFIHGPGGNFNFNRVGVAGNQFVFTTVGNLIIQGTLSQSSSRAVKKDFTPIESREILARVAELPLTSWTYKTDNARHVGPMAEDFHSAFGLGADESHLAPGDVAGVALAAIQGLNETVRDQDAQLAALEHGVKATLEEKDERIAALEKELAEVKAALAKLLETQP